MGNLKINVKNLTLSRVMCKKNLFEIKLSIDKKQVYIKCHYDGVFRSDYYECLIFNPGIFSYYSGHFIYIYSDFSKCRCYKASKWQCYSHLLLLLFDHRIYKFMLRPECISDGGGCCINPGGPPCGILGDMGTPPGGIPGGPGCPGWLTSCIGTSPLGPSRIGTIWAPGIPGGPPSRGIACPAIRGAP